MSKIVLTTDYTVFSKTGKYYVFDRDEDGIIQHSNIQTEFVDAVKAWKNSMDRGFRPSMIDPDGYIVSYEEIKKVLWTL